MKAKPKTPTISPSIKKLILICIAIFATLIVLLYIALEFGLKDTIKEQIITAIETNISKSDPKAQLEIGDIGFSLVNILKLNPVIQIKDIKHSYGFQAKELDIAVELIPLFSKRLDLTSVHIRDMTLTLKPPRQKEIVIPSLNAEIKNISSGKKAEIKIWANIYGSKISKFEYEGSIGPIPDLDKLALIKELPLDGKANLTLVFTEIPLKVRQKLFGAILMSPHSSDKVTMNAQLRGDILHIILGSGIAKLDRVRLGKSPERHMIATAQMPFNLSINAIETQKAYFNINSARIVLTAVRGSRQSGEINMQARYTSDLPTGMLYSTITGNLKNIDINELISSFTPTEDVIYGIFTVPSFRLDMHGVTNPEQMESLTGSGSMSIDNVNAPLIDKLLAFKDFVKTRDIGNGIPAVKEHVIGKLNSSFNISDAKFNTPDLAINTPLAQLHGSGFFNFRPVVNGNAKNPKINYDMNLEVGTLPAVPLMVRGDSAKPTIKADVKSFATQTGQQLVKQILYQKFMSQAGGASNGQVVNPPKEVIPAEMLNKLLKIKPRRDSLPPPSAL